MNKSIKRRLLDQHRRKTAALREGTRAGQAGAAKTSYGSLSFDNGYPSNVSVRELEAYFDDAWRMIGSDKSPWEE
jgi:hypothetical protein